MEREAPRDGGHPRRRPPADAAALIDRLVPCADPPRGERSLALGALRPPHRSHHRALPPTAEEPIAPIRLEPRHADTSRHLDLLQNLSGESVDPPDIAR